VQPTIDLAPGAESNRVASVMAARIEQTILVPSRLEDFRSMRGAVLLVAQDSGIATTLRFDHGRLTVHDGWVGIPTITLCADESALLALCDMSIGARRGQLLPDFDDARGTGVLVDTARRFARSELKVYGLLRHPRLTLRFLRLLARS
jgi:hypothetical protein